MKVMKLVSSMMLMVFLVHPWVSSAASAQTSSHTTVPELKKPEPRSGSQPSMHEKKSGSGAEMPVYKPPLRGAPAGRVGGGTRGGADARAYLLVLAPDHVGLTTQRQPSLYWFLSAPTAHPIEFTLIENKAAKPLLEKKLEPSTNSGLQCVKLSDHGVSLRPDLLYQWFVTLIPDPGRRSKDILSGGFIERIEPSGGLQEKLDQGEKTKAVHIYAEAGLWYDAFMTVCDMIEVSPVDVRLRRMRSSLLEQVGLDQVAEDLNLDVDPGNLGDN